MNLELLTSAHRHRILFECVSGSRAYGTSNAESDTDIRGVFAQSSADFVALSPPTALIYQRMSKELTPPFPPILIQSTLLVDGKRPANPH